MLPSPSPFILTFQVAEAALPVAGGKGANLVRLTRAGQRVPPGFILSTQAYHAYVAANDLQRVITAQAQGLAATDAAGLEQASTAIRAAFRAEEVDPDLRAQLRSAYADLGGGAVAVRSSATFEDLPDLSFAGQQDTFLNVQGEESLTRAVVDCWSSLWTARAIGYRLRNGLDAGAAGLAVVVQTMVPAEVSGVLFTANPLSGQRDQMSVDATWGLGEALVSGQVQPDHFLLDAASGEVLQQEQGAKEVITRSKPGGGVESVAQDKKALSLSADQLRCLAAAGRAIQAEYGKPMDIEWAWADGGLYILQAREITSLFPIPWIAYDPLTVWFSFGAVQGLVGPLTPLGIDAIRHIAATAGSMFGQKLDPGAQTVMCEAGERIWIRISDVMRNPLGKRLYLTLLNYIEPSVSQTLQSHLDDPRLGVGQGKMKAGTIWGLLGFFVPIAARILLTFANPRRARQRFDALIEKLLAAMEFDRVEGDRFTRLQQVVEYFMGSDKASNALPLLLPRFIPLFGPSMASLMQLKELGGDEALALEVTRSLPNNVTSQMDLALWQVAQAIHADPASVQAFSGVEAAELARDYLAAALPSPAQTAVQDFMRRYGARGVGEIDLGQPRWREDPTPVMHTLQSYLAIDPQSPLAPDVQYARGAQAAEEAIEEIVARARRRPGGWFKARVARIAGERLRILMGARESPKFFAIRAMGIGRAALLDCGADFVAAGTLERPADLGFLSLQDLQALAGKEQRDWKGLVAERRARYEHELRRRQVPRVLFSDGRAFYAGIGAMQGGEENGISGSPVSPGIAEGLVRVVLDPRQAHLEPGEILVCPGTDPAWTPLFMAAAGLVTEVGGLMTHGSVVARELGIPAVVGVDRATLRLQDGQRIRIDGTNGKIYLL